MSHFNKRHYQAIAQVMQEARMMLQSNDQATAQDALAVVRSGLCGLFASDNHLFKRDLFLQACQPGANVRARTVKLTPGGSVECPHCHWGFAPSAIDQHMREKH